MQEGTRRIPIVSARQLGKGQSQNKTSYLPLRLNQGGVMPIIFASAVLVLPAYLQQVISNEIIKNLFLQLSPAGKQQIYLHYLLFFINLYSSATFIHH